MNDDQSEAVRALQSGEATGDPGPLKRIDTHLSHVFLGADRAYKLKRALRMPFVDFSTLEKRRLACEAEIDANRRFAPELYLACAPLVRTAGGLRLDAPGEAQEWLVVMRRFPDGALFDQLAQAGRLRVEDVGAAAEAVARAHAAAPPAAAGGRTQDYRRIVEGLRRTEAEGAARHGLTPGPDDLYAGIEAALAAAAPLVEARRAAGRVRRGHGDLHLRNLCLFQGRALAFDALEFDPALATSDVLYDLAFLLMDLRRRGLAAHANAAMNRYFDAAAEGAGGLALLPAFMALRAAVRCAVAMEAGDAAEAAGYRGLGLELLAPVGPRLVAIGGLSGSGKSAVARRIAPRLPGVCGARILRTDVLRKAAAGAAPDERLPEAAYSPARRLQVYRALAAEARRGLQARCSVLADATFQQAEARSAIAAVAPAFRGLWLRAGLQVRLARVAGRSGDASDATAEVARAQAEPELEPGWTEVSAEGTLEDVATLAAGALGL
jgi:aminoglycoside phosphotransferase family enzyme/predicted kinase